MHQTLIHWMSVQTGLTVGLGVLLILCMSVCAVKKTIIPIAGQATQPYYIPSHPERQALLTFSQKLYEA